VGTSFVIYDYMGKSVFTGNISSEISNINLSNLSSGNYLLGIGNDKENLVKLKKE
jgi:hypothetical protein